MGFRYVQVSLCALLVFICGCSNSGNIGAVEGTVTVDGVPADRATVSFYPTEGRPSLGYTDQSGHYTLIYSRDAKGAVIGQHKVTISTELEKDYMDGADQEERKETMPAKFLDRDTTELTATVESGDNEINFDFKSAEF